MKQRVITGAFLVLILVLAFAASGTFVLPLICSVLSSVGVYELAKLFHFHQKKALLGISLIFAFIVPFSAHLIDKDSFILLPNTANLLPSEILTLVLCSIVVFSFACFLYSIFTGGTIPFSTVLSFCFMVIYVTIGFLSIVLLRRMGNLYIAIFVFIGSWISDTFAYFTGVLFGKHKLCPQVSPKKTIEGSLGGIVFSALIAAVFGIVLKSADLINESNIVWLALAGAILSIASQVGDLTASLLKREYNIKDYGRLFPGHGGVLDRFDSVIAVAPLLLIFATLIGETVSILGCHILWF